jgi:hypothetical protein
MNLRHTVVFRKTRQLVLRVPRFVARLGADDEAYRTRPALLANSFPKSGTHLLLQALQALPGTRSYGSFIASQPSYTFVERSRATHLRLIRAMAPGEVVPAHLFHDATYADAVRRRSLHFFIYRDLRDVVVSEAFYLGTMNRWHALHRFFKHRTLAERLMLSILGMSREDCGYEYPDIGTRFRRFAPWLREPGVTAFRFEDLAHTRQAEHLRQIVSLYLSRINSLADVDQTLHHVQTTMAPSKSHTFREGKSGGWRKYFRAEHVDAMKRVAGDLLVSLGYESNDAW